MMGIGTGDNGQLTFLDYISLMSFFIGLMNLDENLSQGDKQDILSELSNKADILLREIHAHLQRQDEKLDMILKGMSE